MYLGKYAKAKKVGEGGDLIALPSTCSPAAKQKWAFDQDECMWKGSSAVPDFGGVFVGHPPRTTMPPSQASR